MNFEKINLIKKKNFSEIATVQELDEFMNSFLNRINDPDIGDKEINRIVSQVVSVRSRMEELPGVDIKELHKITNTFFRYTGNPEEMI